MSVRTMRRRPGPCSPPSQLMSRPSASKQLPLVRPLSARKTLTAPLASIFRMRLPAMSLKKTFPAASTAGPSRKQITAAALATTSLPTRLSGSGVLERSCAALPGQRTDAATTARHRAATCFDIARILRWKSSRAQKRGDRLAATVLGDIERPPLHFEGGAWRNAHRGQEGGMQVADRDRIARHQ